MYDPEAPPFSWSAATVLNNCSNSTHIEASEVECPPRGDLSVPPSLGQLGKGVVHRAMGAFCDSHRVARWTTKDRQQRELSQIVLKSSCAGGHGSPP
jgi:hypothetical protein